ncbi:MAG TPA: hypothetical protein DCL44_01270 [Elusimicrobia bacterium]|nr:hypothetical protein [Elusimicrobiota bacterium]
MKQKRQGQTLIEVCVATIIAATVTMGVFSVVLSGFASQKKADKREMAGLMLKQAQETLKSYVSADPTNSNFTSGTVPLVTSPGSPGSPIGHWPAEQGNTTWALAGALPPGRIHIITPLLIGTPLADAVTGLPAPSFKYTVTNVNCLRIGSGIYASVPINDSNQCKVVVFELIYLDI